MLELADRLASGASAPKERGSSSLPLGTSLTLSGSTNPVQCGKIDFHADVAEPGIRVCLRCI